MNKKLLFAAIVFWGISAPATVAQVYLHSLEPVRKNAYTVAADMRKIPSVDHSDDHVIAIGGIPYKTGFILTHLNFGQDRQGYVEYSLKGRYKTLTFIMGTSPVNDPNFGKGILGISLDGRKVVDEIITSHSVPTRMTLDVSGADMLRFELTQGEVAVGIVEAALWTASQTPKELGRTGRVGGAKPVSLVGELRPYFKNNGHTCISPNDGDEHSVSINGRTYTSGLKMRAAQSILSNAEAASLFNLDGKYKTLRFIAGPEDTRGGEQGEGWLTVRADGKIIYEYEFTSTDIVKQVTLDIEGCRQLAFESEQRQHKSFIIAADIMVYPAGQEPGDATGDAVETAVVDPRLRALPDVCKLVSNIPPYAVAGRANQQNNVFDGRSEHITFSMGGVKFNEGVILQSVTHVMNDNTRADAMFNLGGEFDYVSFTAGWVSKCGVLKNDTLRVYADDKVVMNMPLIATHPNKDYVVPIYKCQRLRFEKRGMESMNHPVFGIADIVVYRGEPVENDLFRHPTPPLPDEVDLISLGDPYILHSNSRDREFSVSEHRYLDGSTKKLYYEVGGRRIYSGFVLATSVHFDMEFKGGGAASAAVAASSIGSSVVIGTIGNATISAVSPFGALLMLAAGGSGYESSCAAFNTYGAYDEVTFTVACYKQAISKQREILQIGGDGEVIQEIEISDFMEPTTFTIPIGKCHQLMFWLKCGDSGSGDYLFYDIKLRKTGAPAFEFGKGSVSSQITAGSAAIVSAQAGALADAAPYTLPVETFQLRRLEWEKPQRTKVEAIDKYFAACWMLKGKIDNFLGTTRDYGINRKKYAALSGATYDKMTDGGARYDYRTQAKVVTASDGNNYRAIELLANGQPIEFDLHQQRNNAIISAAKAAVADIMLLKVDQATANLALPSLGLGALSAGKLIKQAAAMLDAYKEQLEALIAEKQQENKLIASLEEGALNIDGTPSTDSRIFIK